MSTARSRSLVAVVSLLGATVFWAGNYLVSAAALTATDPLSLTLLRWLLASVPLLLIAQLVERPDWRRLLRAWPWLLALSATGMVGYTLLLYVALQFTDPFNASIINSFNPVAIALAAALLLRQRLTALSVAGILLALLGVLVVLSRGELGTLLAGGFGVGDVLMIGAVLMWTAYTVLGRFAPRLPAIASTALQAVIVVVVLAPVSLVLGGPALPATGEALWALLYIALFPSVLSYLLWNRAMAVLPPAGGGVFLNLVAVFVAVLTVLTGQAISWPQLVGGAIVLLGVVLANLHALRRADPASAAR